MEIIKTQNYSPKFGNSLGFTVTNFIEERILLNKALVDASVDVPMVVMANNKTERKEKFNRCAIAWVIAFVSPVVMLPLVNRLALKYISKTSPKLFSKESKLIELSNVYLINKKVCENGIKSLSASSGMDFSSIVNKFGGDYEKIRQKLINAKMSVLSFDLALTGSAIGSIGYYNNWNTKRKTGRDGYSAEFNMAEKEITDKRAQKFKKNEKFRKATFASLIGLLAIIPLILKKGLNSNAKNGFTKYIQEIAPKFNYKDGLFMGRMPLFFAALAAYYGMASASRNQTEMKDNLIRSLAGGTAFFGGDIIIGSVLGKLSDKFLKTNIINKDCKKTLLNRIIPPIKQVKDLEGRPRKIAIKLFWVNMGSLALIIGAGVPYLINKMIKKDVNKDLNRNTISENKSEVFKDFKL